MCSIICPHIFNLYELALHQTAWQVAIIRLIATRVNLKYSSKVLSQHIIYVIIHVMENVGANLLWGLEPAKIEVSTVEKALYD